MTDKEYIQAFYNSNQLGIREAYVTFKKDFLSFIKFKCPLLSDIFYEDVYHDAFMAVQQNILAGKICEDTLTSSLSSYLNSVGIYCAMHMMRANKEVYTSGTAWDALINGKPLQGDDLTYGYQYLWIEEVEEPFNLWCANNPNSKKEEKSQEYDRLCELYTDKHKSKAALILDDVVVTMEDLIDDERNKIIREQVVKMEKPCAPLLLGAIWEGKSNAELAVELEYKTADVVKNQKSRCLKTIKGILRKILKQCGYDYE